MKPENLLKSYSLSCNHHEVRVSVFVMWDENPILLFLLFLHVNYAKLSYNSLNVVTPPAVVTLTSLPLVRGKLPVRYPSN